MCIPDRNAHTEFTTSSRRHLQGRRDRAGALRLCVLMTSPTAAQKASGVLNHAPALKQPNPVPARAGSERSCLQEANTTSTSVPSWQTLYVYIRSSHPRSYSSLVDRDGGAQGDPNDVLCRCSLWQILEPYTPSAQVQQTPTRPMGLWARRGVGAFGAVAPALGGLN